jgi:hypothetical protein
MNARGLILTVFILALVGIAGATPTTGAASGVNSNGFNTTTTGITGTDNWIWWGGSAGNEMFVSPNTTAVAGSALNQVTGSPVMGSMKIYFRACDTTGCGSELSTTTSAITPLPTTTFGKHLKNITDNHFSSIVIINELGNSAAGSTGAPTQVLLAVIYLFVIIGIWHGTKSVKIPLIMGLLFVPLIISPTVGLMLGMPAVAVQVASILMGLAIGGVLFIIARK